MIVRIAAMNVWSISRLNGRIPEKSEKKPITLLQVTHMILLHLKLLKLVKLKMLQKVKLSLC